MASERDRFTRGPQWISRMPRRRSYFLIQPDGNGPSGPKSHTGSRTLEEEEGERLEMSQEAEDQIWL